MPHVRNISRNVSFDIMMLLYQINYIYIYVHMHPKCHNFSAYCPRPEKHMYTHNVPSNRNEGKCHIDYYQHISSDMPGIDSAQKQMGPSASSVAQN